DIAWGLEVQADLACAGLSKEGRVPDYLLPQIEQAIYGARNAMGRGKDTSVRARLIRLLDIQAKLSLKTARLDQAKKAISEARSEIEKFPEDTLKLKWRLEIILFEIELASGDLVERLKEDLRTLRKKQEEFLLSDEALALNIEGNRLYDKALTHSDFDAV